MPFDDYTASLAFALKDAEEDTDGTSEFATQAGDAVVEYFREFCSRHPWLNLRKYPDGALVTVAPVTTLTMTAAAGTAVTGSISSAYATSLANYVFVPTGKDYVIRVTSHTAATTVVVFDAVPEALSAQEGTFAKLEYDTASDVDLFVDGLWSRGSFVPMRGLDALLQAYPIPVAADVPEMFARIGETKIRLCGWTSQARRFDYPYTAKPSDPSGSTTLVLPSDVRAALAHRCVARVFELKGDQRWKDRLTLAEAGLENAILRDIKRTIALTGAGNAARPGAYASSGRRRGRW